MKNNGKIIKTVMENLKYYKRIFKTIFVFFRAFLYSLWIFGIKK